MNSLRVCIPSVLLLSATVLAGCGTMSQFTYDGAGNFRNLVSCRNQECSFNDKVGEYDFDSVILFHVRVTDRSPEPEEYGSQYAMFRLTDACLSAPEMKEELRKRGDFARFYHHRIYGDWEQTDSGNVLDGCAILGVKSRIGEVILTRVRLKEFAASAWLDIPVNKTIRIVPGRINYLGTLSIEIEASGEYSERTIKQAYFQYDTAIVEGMVYNTAKRLALDDRDLERDKDMLRSKYPNLLVEFGDNFAMTR